ncbi:uncharacterized protein UTRI_06433 [Ustilago trichophora]|uniref:Transmembrane protein n=1 Tax=Ustilago trichophora TaxID=86804 RepID=A0A5C3EIS6_9BASI|nr:uncharacterized protein UTRI_06433 [Ustilago trichophora]
MNSTWDAWSAVAPSATQHASTSYATATTQQATLSPSNATSAYSSANVSVTPVYSASNMSSDSSSVTPDVVANPWNTSLLWSSGIIDNRDPRSNFWPADRWRNTSVPGNLNTAPIGYYYSSSNAGDSVNFYFTGHGLSVLDFRGPTRGRYNVTIDGESSVIIDAYSQVDELAKASGSTLPPVIWTSDTFEEGTHSVVMSNLNNISDMNFWGVVINPNNYKAGTSFMPSKSTNTKLIIIASTVTAVVMVGIFLLAGSIFYYCKLVRPRRRARQQMDAERKETLLPSSSPITETSRRTPRGSMSQLRLNTNFLSSQGDLGRVPSRVTATTNESQYWLRSETDLAQVSDTRQTSTRTPALFQEIRLGSPVNSVTSSPIDFTPATEMDPSSTIYTTNLGEPISPLSPSNNAYASAQTPTHHYAFWDGRSAPHEHAPPGQMTSHHHSHSLNLHIATDIPSNPNVTRSYAHHHRVASSPNVNPFQDPVSPFTATNTTTLARTGSRRPLPTPPTATTPVGPLTTLSPTSSSAPSQSHSNTSGSTSNTSVHPSSSTGRAYRVEQDACSIHLSEDGMFDDHTGETLLPPPYAPRDMGRHFV